MVQDEEGLKANPWIMVAFALIGLSSLILLHEFGHYRYADRYGLQPHLKVIDYAPDNETPRYAWLRSAVYYQQGTQQQDNMVNWAGQYNTVLLPTAMLTVIWLLLVIDKKLPWYWSVAYLLAIATLIDFCIQNNPDLLVKGSDMYQLIHQGVMP